VVLWLLSRWPATQRAEEGSRIGSSGCGSAPAPPGWRVAWGAETSTGLVSLDVRMCRFGQVPSQLRTRLQEGRKISASRLQQPQTSHGSPGDLGRLGRPCLMSPAIGGGTARAVRVHVTSGRSRGEAASVGAATPRSQPATASALS